MCGLFGILQHHATAPPSVEGLESTARRLRHRGPDGSGTFADRGVGLVHTRLSLVDLNERSNQPFWDASGRYCLVYNGELYDYDGLRSELGRLGVALRTTSDTEILLESLIHLGVENTLHRIEGMFAFALYDAHQKSLVMARDRFGIKPLFIYDDDEVFLFSSTIEAMKGWVDLRPDPLMVSAYLQGFNGPMSGRSFYEGVTIVPPGAVVRITLGSRAHGSPCLTMHDLHDPDLAEDLAARSPGEWVDRVEELLLNSVECQLCADVPVGAFCSGGVDSSLIMAMAARSHSDLRVFHADIQGPLSERSAAERLARHLDLEMKVVSVLDQHFIDTLPHIVEHFGSPFANPTTVPVLLVSQLVRGEGIKAVLTGEASDECFLGYPWLVPNLPSEIRSLGGRLLRGLGLRRSGRPPSRVRDRELMIDLASSFELQLGPASFPDTPRREYHAEGRHGLANDAELSYILRTLLHRNDTMGMAASIESRFPFLDSRLVTLAVNLPYAAKIRFSPSMLDRDQLFYRDKWVVRQVADRYLPAELSQRKKGMFPTSAFGRMVIDDRLFEDSFVADWYRLARPRLAHLLDNATRDLKLRLMLFDTWGRVCVRSDDKAEVSARLLRHVSVLPA